MKVIQFIPTLDSGGVEQGVLEISEALIAKGHDSHIVSAGGRMVEVLIKGGAKHHQWNIHKKNLFTLSLVRPLREWIVSMKADIIHVRSRMPAWVVWRALKGIPIDIRPKLISTVHGLHSINFYSAVMTKPDNIIAVSNCSKDYIINNYTKSQSKNIRLIYRGVDNSSYHMDYKPSSSWLSEWYEQYPETHRSKLLTIAGRISPLKDFEKIIYLAKSIKESSSHSFKVLIAGEAKDKHLKYLNKLKNLIKSLDLSDEIYFLNYRKDIKDIFAISNIAFNTSNKPESFGRSVLEPLSLGIPTIGYNRGGVKEILQELYPYGAVEPNNHSDLLDKTLSILNGNNLDIKTNSKFLTSEMCHKTISFYKEILT
jgi:glycosyltransferase involved in cell wall biosynthesis